MDLEDFHFPLICECPVLMDWDLKRLPLDLFLKHEGYEIKIKNKKYILEISDYQTHPRDSLKLQFSNWVGFSPDASTYAALVLPHISIRTPRTNIFHEGYGFPNFLREIELTRPVTKVDLRNRDKSRNIKLRDRIRGFNNEDEILVRVKKVMEKYLPGFKLVKG